MKKIIFLGTLLASQYVGASVLEATCQNLTIKGSDELTKSIQPHFSSLDYQGSVDCVLNIKSQRASQLWHPMNSYNQSKVYEQLTLYQIELLYGDIRLIDEFTHKWLVNDRAERKDHKTLPIAYQLNKSLAKRLSLQ